MSAQANRVMTLEEWEERWQQRQVNFHKPYVHKLLENNIDQVVCGRKGIRFFIPLCGKSVDMKWLADMGHTIVGVEISETAIRQFFEEHSLGYKEEAVPDIAGAKVFKSTDGKITLYLCDIRNFPSGIEGKFGAIWDSGSLEAINPCDRERYAKLMISLMDKDCRYILNSMDYNPELYKGPPFVLPDKELKDLYGMVCDIEPLQTVDVHSDIKKRMGLDFITEKVQLLKPKAN